MTGLAALLRQTTTSICSTKVENHEGIEKGIDRRSLAFCVARADQYTSYTLGLQLFADICIVRRSRDILLNQTLKSIIFV